MSLSDLQNECRQVKSSLKELQAEINSLQSRKRKLQGRCDELQVQIEVRQAEQSAVESSGPKWSSGEFPWRDELHKKLREVFGMHEFREKQLEAMNATLSGEDVFLVMPTGGGKSLCYQLPALLCKGVTLVVSPLVSLMEDQCHHMKRFGVESAFLSADTAKETASSVTKELSSPTPATKLLYVTPEKIAKSKRFMAQLEKCYKRGNLSRIAIDEAHCASQWGNDFRPDYKLLGILKRQYPNTPLLALTATATNKVIADTKKMLNIPQALVFKTGLNRANLFYEVRIKPKSHNDVIDDLVMTIKKSFAGKSGIIYCFSRADSAKVSESLNEKGIRASCYHAYMTPQSRTSVHEKWRDGHIQVICATVAFGMGIDKPDVRFVIHHSISKSVENYYQESGRAGRDGDPALCRVYFGFQDMFRQSTMVLTEQTGLENLANMVEYCFNLKKCRREMLGAHFGERFQSMTCNRACDNCSQKSDSTSCDVTNACRALLAIVRAAESKGEGHRLTALKLVEAAAGRGPEKSSDAALLQLPPSRTHRTITHMLMSGYLREDFHFTPYSTISYIIPGNSLHIDSVRIRLDFPSTQSLTTSYDELFSAMTNQNDVTSHKRKSNDNVTSSKRRHWDSSVPILIDDSD